MASRQSGRRSALLLVGLLTLGLVWALGPQFVFSWLGRVKLRSLVVILVLVLTLSLAERIDRL